MEGRNLFFCRIVPLFFISFCLFQTLAYAANFYSFFVVLLFQLSSAILLLIGTLLLIDLILNRKEWRGYFIALTLCLVPLFLVLIENKLPKADIVLRAYQDQEINGGDISFKSNYEVVYTNYNMFWERYYYGTYKMDGDVYIVDFSGSYSPIPTNKVIKNKSKLLFLNQKDSIVYSFNLEDHNMSDF